MEPKGLTTGPKFMIDQACSITTPNLTTKTNLLQGGTNGLNYGSNFHETPKDVPLLLLT